MSFTLGERDFSSAVSGFCQVFLVTRLRPKTPKIPAEREKSLWYPGYVSFFQISLKNSALKATHNYFRDCRVHIFRQPFLKKLYSCMWLHFIANLSNCTFAVSGAIRQTRCVTNKCQSQGIIAYSNWTRKGKQSERNKRETYKTIAFSQAKEKLALTWTNIQLTQKLQEKPHNVKERRYDKGPMNQEKTAMKAKRTTK